MNDEATKPMINSSVLQGTIMTMIMTFLPLSLPSLVQLQILYFVHWPNRKVTQGLESNSPSTHVKHEGAQSKC